MANEKAQELKSKDTPTNSQTMAATPQAEQTPYQINTTSLKSSYCNVCSGTSTREEVVA